MNETLGREGAMRWKSYEKLVGFLVLVVALYPLSHRVPFIPRWLASVFMLLGSRDLADWVQTHMQTASFAHWWAAISLSLLAAYLAMRARDAGSEGETSPFLMRRLISRWRWQAMAWAGLGILLVVLLGTRG